MARYLISGTESPFYLLQVISNTAAGNPLIAERIPRAESIWNFGRLLKRART